MSFRAIVIDSIMRQYHRRGTFQNNNNDANGDGRGYRPLTTSSSWLHNRWRIRNNYCYAQCLLQLCLLYRLHVEVHSVVTYVSTYLESCLFLPRTDSNQDSKYSNQHLTAMLPLPIAPTPCHAKYWHWINLLPVYSQLSYYRHGNQKGSSTGNNNCYRLKRPTHGLTRMHRTD